MATVGLVDFGNTDLVLVTTLAITYLYREKAMEMQHVMCIFPTMHEDYGQTVISMI